MSAGHCAESALRTFGLLCAQERTRANDARSDYEPALRKASTTRARRWTQ